MDTPTDPFWLYPQTLKGMQWRKPYYNYSSTVTGRKICVKAHINSVKLQKETISSVLRAHAAMCQSKEGNRIKDRKSEADLARNVDNSYS